MILIILLEIKLIDRYLILKIFLYYAMKSSKKKHLNFQALLYLNLGLFIHISMHLQGQNWLPDRPEYSLLAMQSVRLKESQIQMVIMACLFGMKNS